MADLIDRLAGTDETRPKIAVHQFTAGLVLYASGAVTGSEVAQDWDLQGAELTQANALAAAVDAKSTALLKTIYVLKVNSVCMLLEDTNDTIYHNPDGTINKARVAADLEI